jgi:hypothetical protein
MSDSVVMRAPTMSLPSGRTLQEESPTIGQGGSAIGVQLSATGS